MSYKNSEVAIISLRLLIQFDTEGGAKKNCIGTVA